MINFQVISGANTAAAAGKAAKYPQEKQERHTSRDGTEYSTGYYTQSGGAPSQWIGKGAEAQGLSGAVNEAELARAFLGQIKDGPDISGRGGKSADAERRYAMDLTLSAPKSVSIAALAGGDERLIDAHDRAVRAAMEYVENHMVYARIGKGGADSEFTKNAVIASHRHETARTVDGIADPQLHTHNLVLNQTVRKDGTWVSARVDFGKNNEKFNALDSIYKAELAKNVKAAGYEIENTKDGFEIKGISRDQIEQFSRRKEQIDAALDESGTTRAESTAQQRDAANLRTRGHKSQLNNVEQHYEWRSRVREQGLDLHGLREQSQERNAAGGDRQRITGEDAVKSAIHHLSERDSTFSKTALLDEALKAGLGDVSHTDIEKAIASRAGGLVSAGEIDRGEGKTEQQFTTKAAIYREAEILQRATDGQGKAAPLIAIDEHEVQGVVKDVSFTNEELENGRRNGSNQQQPAGSEIGSIEEVEPLTGHRMRDLSQRNLDANQERENPDLLQGNALSDRSGNQSVRWADDGAVVSAVIAEREAKQGFLFSSGQREAVALALTTTDQHIGIVGAAGAGKTTAMAAIVEQYQKAGYEIIGVAPSAAAAHELKSAGCNDTRTLASSLLKKEEQTKEGDTPKRLYILDEAGMVSAKDMDAFMRKADAESARTILVGDPLQLAAVEAGSPYAQMMKTGAIAYANIDEIQRQKDPQLREIAQAFARGDAAKGVELAKPYIQQVAVDKEGGKEAKQDALSSAAAQAYLDLSPEERQKTLLLAGTNTTRQAINSKIRDGLVKDGTLGDRSVTITALDKLDLTREAATRAEHYTSKDGAQVVIQFNSDMKNKEQNGGPAILAEKGSQWDVTGTTGGKLHLQSRDDPTRTLEMRPTDARISAYAAREMELRAGDRIAFRQNDKERGITNGTQGTVSIDSEGKTNVKTDSGQAVPIAQNRGQTLDYSYARTVHSSQGATVERAIVVGEASRVATAESAYVACSREKTGLTIITDNSEKLGKAWGRFAERQNALDAAKANTPETLQEIQAARREAEHETGKIGDLSAKREQPEKDPQREAKAAAQRTEETAAALAAAHAASNPETWHLAAGLRGAALDHGAAAQALEHHQPQTDAPAEQHGEATPEQREEKQQEQQMERQIEHESER